MMGVDVDDTPKVHDPIDRMKIKNDALMIKREW